MHAFFILSSHKYCTMLKLVSEKRESHLLEGGKKQINNPIAFSKLKNGSKLRSGFVFTKFVNNSKRFTFLNIFVGKKVHKKFGIFTNPVCNTFSKWCQKCEKMMDIDASRKSWILAQKASRCWNSLPELIYFLVTVSILFFRKHLSRNRTWKNSVHALFMLPQNFGTKFEIQQKVLTEGWIPRVSFWKKVFFGSWAH